VTMVAEKRWSASCFSTSDTNSTCSITTDMALDGVEKTTYRFWPTTFLTSTLSGTEYKTFVATSCASQQMGLPSGEQGRRVCAKP